MTPERYRLAGWLVSGCCLVLSAGLLVQRHAAFMASASAERNAAVDLMKAREALDALQKQPADRRFACAPREKDEETRFLLDLRRRAHQAGVSIVRWSSHATTYATKMGEKPQPDAKVIEGVTKIGCDLGLAGSYPGLRSLLADLARSDRLLTVSHVEWNRTDKGSELSMSLGRYLKPAEGAPRL